MKKALAFSVFLLFFSFTILSVYTVSKDTLTINSADIEEIEDNSGEELGHILFQTLNYNVAIISKSPEIAFHLNNQLYSEFFPEIDTPPNI
jgi:hypothetical protein